MEVPFFTVALELGLLVSLLINLFNWIIWLAAVWAKVRVEALSMFFGIGNTTFKQTINGIELSFGWLPLGGNIKLAGMLDHQDEDQLQAAAILDQEAAPRHEFKSRSLSTRWLIILISPLSLCLIGILLLIISAQNSLWTMLLDYIYISCFLLPLQSGAYIWEQLWTSPVFFAGVLFTLFGVVNLITNAQQIFGNSEGSVLFYVLLPMAGAIFLLMGLLRLLWENLSWNAFFEYLVGAYVVGILAFIIAIILAKLLPNA